ncbi:MAG: DNA cytosine methyltransferase [Zoogloeaceae bacterium]|jgi:DNA (cytosine-5)-methyltransferase 1|nr:DNA cytosine methyltransferase [Zoogloeaceae bacterium]
MKSIVDLFAGCGGLSRGFQDAGFDIVGAFEYWGTAAACYEANFDHPVFRDDLSDVQAAVSGIKKLSPEIIIGGPPCQDFSHAGKRIEDKRAALTEAYAEIIFSIRPRWFVMENVDRAQKSGAYAAAREIFKGAGYGLTETVLDASLCGVPQKRKRFFCIGSLGAEDGFLESYIASHLSKKETTLRDYFGDSLDFEYYYRHPRNYSRRAVYSIDEPSPTVRGMNRPVPPGYPGHPNDASELDNTIRALTTLERALIQTFPPNFRWAGNKTEIEQMIGNAVPVKLAEFVAKALAHHIGQCERQVDYSAFSDWLTQSQPLCERSRRDTVSRLKRADAICALPPAPDAYYLFTLEQNGDYQALSSSVRSQLRRAVTLYSDYRTTASANG